MKYTPYSYSKISTHQQCPKKFFWTYVEKAPKDKMDMTALLKGGAVHSILENYPEKSSHKLREKYQSLVNNFIESDLGKKYLNENSVREHRFGLTEDLQECKYSDKKALIRGSVDYVCVIDECLHLVDWKTGKYKQERWQDFNQLIFYGIYFFQKYQKINKIQISYVYIEHDLENSLLLERKYLTNYISELIELIDVIEVDEEFPKNKGILCDYCHFRTHCNQN